MAKPAYNISRGGIKLNSFELPLIDKARMKILSLAENYSTPLNINEEMPYEPYVFSVGKTQNDNRDKSGNPSPFNGNMSWFNQAGLGLRTYLSDRFNNWLSTEWIDGTNGINEVTAIQIVDNKLTMDALILQKKIFDMMNRIAISGGSYNDWQEAVYGVRVARMAESPIYMGGASYEIVFSEVVSNSATEKEPLGSLAGRGTEVSRKGDTGGAVAGQAANAAALMEVENQRKSLALQQASMAKDIQLKDAEIKLKNKEADKAGQEALYTEALKETEDALREARVNREFWEGRLPWLNNMRQELS